MIHHLPSPETGEQARTALRKESERLRDCSHLVSLLADEIEALEVGDLPRLREIGGMRAKLVAELGEEDPAVAETELHLWLLGRLEEALRRLDDRAVAERRAHDELALLQNGSLPLVRGLQRLPGNGHYAALDALSAQVDVRL